MRFSVEQYNIADNKGFKLAQSVFNAAMCYPVQSFGGLPAGVVLRSIFQPAIVIAMNIKLPGISSVSDETDLIEPEC